MLKRIIFLVMIPLLIFLNAEICSSAQKRPKILILPIHTEKEELKHLQWGLWNLIKGRIESKGSVDVIEKGELLRLNLKEGGPSERGEILRVAKELSADYALRVLIKGGDSGFSADMFLYSMNGENEEVIHVVIKDQDHIFHQLAGAALQIAEVISYWEGLEEPPKERAALKKQEAPQEKRIPSGLERHEALTPPKALKSTGEVVVKDIPYHVRSITACDIDGDGSDEIAILTKSEIIFYRLSGSELEEINRYRKGAMELVSISSGDFNEDGICELYVSALEGGRPSSLVLQMEEGSVKEIKNGLPFFIASVPSRKGKVLLIQEMDSTGYGKIFPTKWHKNNIEKITSHDYKNYACTIFSMSICDIDGDGSDEVICQDEKGSFIIAGNQGAKIEQQSFSLNFNSFEFIPDWARAHERVNPCCYLKIPQRVSSSDIDGDGGIEILTVKNYYSNLIEKSSGLPRGYISQIAISQNGDRILEIWKGREMRGYVTDFSYGEFARGKEKKKAICYAVVISAGGMVTKPSSSIVIEFIQTK